MYALNRKFSKCLMADPCKEFKSLILDPLCKVAIVTGAGSGIGFSAACELLTNGARAVIVAHNNERAGMEAVEMLSNNYGLNKAIYMPCDVNSSKQFEDVFTNTLAKFKKIDILVNNAGVIDDKNWCKTICTNVTGVIRGMLLAQKHMSAFKGTVVNIGATAGLNPWPNCPVFSASKHAVVAATKSFGDHFHYGKTNIRVMGLCPSFTNTPTWIRGLHNHLFEDWARDTRKCLNPENMQSPSMVAKGMIHIIKYGKTGSIWVCEKGRLYEIMMPSLNNMLSEQSAL